MSLFTMLPVTLPDKAMPLVSGYRYVPAYDPNAAEHWIFDSGDSGCLRGRRNAGQLTLQGSAPTYGSGYVILPGASGNALLTPYADSAAAVDTMCAVVKVPAASNGSRNALFGSGTGSGGTGTLAIFNAATPKKFAASVGTSVYQSTDEAAPADSWYFVAIARDMTQANMTERLYVGGIGQKDTALHFTYASNTNKIAVGNGYHAGASTQSINVAEFIYFDSMLTYDDLAVVYAQSKLRMADLGITVV